MPQWDLRAPKVGEFAGKHDRRPAGLHRLGNVSGVIRLVVATLERRPFVAEQRAADLNCLLESIQALARRGERKAVAGVLDVVPRGAEPAALRYLRAQRRFGFPMFSDPDGTALSRWGMLDCAGLFLLDRDLVVRQRALGMTLAPDTIVSFLQRGGARRPKVKLRDRALHFLQAIQHAFRPLRPAR